jgi:hypothetical protein
MNVFNLGELNIYFLDSNIQILKLRPVVSNAENISKKAPRIGVLEIGKSETRQI